jgi:cytoskeletal protein RodZ
MNAERADFGARLRDAREARGLSLRQIAAATKISVMALEALERNDRTRLPGGLFSRAFVRAYAGEVGLDPDQAVREFLERFPDDLETAPPPDGVRKRPASDEIAGGGSHSGLRWLGLAVTISLIIVWVGVDRYYSNRTEGAKPGPSTRVAPGAAPAPPPGQPTQAGTQADARPQGAGARSPVAQPATEAAPPDASLPLHVVVSAHSDCWVSASTDGKRVAGRTLKPGEKLELAAARSIVLTAGDAAALSYTVNNAPGRSLGGAGQVVTAVITTANYQTFVAGRQ